MALQDDYRDLNTFLNQMKTWASALADDLAKYVEVSGGIEPVIIITTEKQALITALVNARDRLWQIKKKQTDAIDSAF